MPQFYGYRSKGAVTLAGNVLTGTTNTYAYDRWNMANSVLCDMIGYERTPMLGKIGTALSPVSITSVPANSTGIGTTFKDIGGLLAAGTLALYGIRGMGTLNISYNSAVGNIALAIGVAGYTQMKSSYCVDLVNFYYNRSAEGNVYANTYLNAYLPTTEATLPDNYVWGNFFTRYYYCQYNEGLSVYHAGAFVAYAFYFQYNRADKDAYCDIYQTSEIDSYCYFDYNSARKLSYYGGSSDKVAARIYGQITCEYNTAGLVELYRIDIRQDALHGHTIAAVALAMSYTNNIRLFGYVYINTTYSAMVVFSNCQNFSVSGGSNTASVNPNMTLNYGSETATNKPHISIQGSSGFIAAPFTVTTNTTKNIGLGQNDTASTDTAYEMTNACVRLTSKCAGAFNWRSGASGATAGKSSAASIIAGGMMVATY
jgi:hypothetical protein